MYKNLILFVTKIYFIQFRIEHVKKEKRLPLKEFRKSSQKFSRGHLLMTSRKEVLVGGCSSFCDTRSIDDGSSPLFFWMRLDKLE